MSSNTAHNMVSSSEVRSSIQKARVSELVKERTIERLKSAEGGAAVEAAVGLHSKALRLVLGRKLVAGTCLANVSLEDVSALVQTAWPPSRTSKNRRVLRRHRGPWGRRRKWVLTYAPA